MNKQQGTKILNDLVASLNDKFQTKKFRWFKVDGGFELTSCDTRETYEMRPVGHIYATNKYRRVPVKTPLEHTRKTLFKGKGSELVGFIENLISDSKA